MQQLAKQHPKQRQHAIEQAPRQVRSFWLGITTTLWIALVAWGLVPQPAPVLGAPMANGPLLALPESLRVGSPGTVSIPLSFAPGTSGVTSLAFGLELEHPCVSLAPGTSDVAEKLVTFHLPSQFRGSASFHGDHGSGQLQIVVADYTPPLSTLPKLDALLELTLQLECEPQPDETITVPLTFSTAPPPSFGNTIGRAVAGSTLDGQLVIEYGVENPTATPIPTPNPHETPVPVNSAPRAQDDETVTTEYRAVTIDVLANDFDPDGDRLTVAEVSQGAFGQVSINMDGTVTYVPVPGRNGQDLFTYTVDDSRGGLDVATVTVTVTGINVPPVAVDDTVATDEDTPVTFAPLDNDYDPDAPNPNDPQLRVAVLGQPVHGKVAPDDDQTITFTPNPDFAGTDTFLYAVTDQEGASAVARVHVTVRSTNDPPVIVPPAKRVFVVGEVVDLPLMYSDVDDDDATLIATVTGLPPGLRFESNTGRIVGQVAAGSEGSYQGTIQVSDDEATTMLDVTWLVTVDIDSLYALFAYTTADGIMLEVSTPSGYELICYELFRRNSSTTPERWTALDPQLTLRPTPDEPDRLLDDSPIEPGIYVYRLNLFEECGTKSRELRSNQVEYAPQNQVVRTYLPLIIMR